MTISDHRMLQWYRKWNRKYFDGMLSEDIDVLYAPSPGCAAYAEQISDGSFVICINPAYMVDKNMARLSLVHEMAHISVWPYKLHGPKFQQEMQRLAAAGAMNRIW